MMVRSLARSPLVSKLLGPVGLILAALWPAWTEDGVPVRYRNISPNVGYVGSISCAGSACHEDICRRYAQTPMGHSMRAANAPSELAKVPKPITIFKAKVNRYFEVFRQGSDIYQSEYTLDKLGQMVFKSTHRLDYVVGAGSTGYTYLFRRGQWFFEAPLSHYSQNNQWDLSPGYDYEGVDIAFTRPITFACMACHNGQPEPVPGRDGMFQDSPFRFDEYAIGCECCHGPGQLHLWEMMQKPRQRASQV